MNAKPEGMSDADWQQGMLIQQLDSQKAAAEGQKQQTGQALTDIYNQQTAQAQESFNSMASQYNTQMKNELEYAGVLHERMKKYLPQQMAAQGMGKMGIAQTAGANAVAKHMSNRNAIIGQNQASLNELSRTHGERQAALDTEYKSGMLGAEQAYNDTINQLNSQQYQNELKLFGMTQEEVKAEQDQYYAAGISGIKEAKTREDALALAEQMKPYVSEAQYQSLVTEANNRGNVLDGIVEEETEASQDKAATQLNSLFANGVSSAKLTETLNSMISAGTIPESDRAYWESLIAAKKAAEDEEATGKATTQQTQAAAEAENLLLQATTAEQRANVLATYKGAVSDAQYRYLESLVGIADGNQSAADTQAGQQKASEQLSLLFANGVDSATLQTTLNSMITAGTIPESDRTYWESLIAAKAKAEAEEAEGKVTQEQMQAAAEAENLILQATTAEQRANVLATYKGAVSDSQYRYLESLAGIADGNQSAADTQAGFDSANADLTTLYSAGASSADLRTMFDSLKEAGKIPADREAYWNAMISLRKKAEDEEAAGKASADQKEMADWGMLLMGDAMTPESRLEILNGMAAWLATGKITQTQYDMAKQYYGVLEGNEAYLEDLESQEKMDAEHAALVDDIIGYIIDVAKDYGEAEAYFNEYLNGGEKFSEAEKRSIDIALKMRQNMDDDDALLKMTEEQSAAYDRCVNMMGLYDTVEGQRGVLEKFKDQLAPEVYEEFKMVLDILAEDPETKATEEEQAREDDAKAKGYGSAAEYDQAVLEGKEYIEYHGAQYKINGEVISVDDMSAKEKQEFTQKLKESGFTNPYGKDIPNGITVKMPKKVAGPIGIEYNAIYVFYNGGWYPAEKVADAPEITPIGQASGAGVLDAIGNRYH